MTDCLLKALTKLIITHKKLKHFAASDFVKQYFKDQDEVEQTTIVNAFLNYNQHETFLEDIAKLFLKECKFFHAKLENVKIQIFFVIFILNSENMQEVIAQSHYYTREMLQFLLTDKYHKLIARDGCKYFENEHILNDIIKPFLSQRSLVESAMNRIAERHFISSPSRKVTVPVEFKFRKRISKSPGPPANTPIECRSRFALQPPITTKYPHIGVLNKIKEAHKNNKERAQHMLKEASSMPKHLTQPRKPVHQGVETKITKITLKSIPPKKYVKIKENLTTTLREGARLLKQEEQEIRNIEELMKGGCALYKLEEVEETYRKNQKQQELETIQRKRLQGLISHEEAIIAKKKLLDNNKRSVQELKQSRVGLLKQLEEWKVQEQEKMKENVDKCQKSKKNLKDMEIKHMEEKQNQVRLQQYETKEMLRKIYEEKENELSKKIELIKEIKAVHAISISMNTKKEFDPTETQNLGLFCEMSIAELQERLILLKMKINDELKAKRQRILKRKSEQQQMIENVKNFIAQNHRMSKAEAVPIFLPKLERSPDLLQLERLLQEKKSLRMRIT